MFDAGIAEQHAVTFAAGLATEGYKPYAAIYSTFLQRAYDQVVHDVAIQNLPVRFAIDRAGLVGADGPTHAGSFDITYLSALPNFIVMAASDEAELVRCNSTGLTIYNPQNLASMIKGMKNTTITREQKVALRKQYEKIKSRIRSRFYEWKKQYDR